MLLFVLAGVVAVIALLALVDGVRPETSCSGIGITIAALVVMPVLAWFKRKVARTTDSRALAADAVLFPANRSTDFSSMHTDALARDYILPQNLIDGE
jgi:divalent metal cation (Fe/Co/Zn/Cd) transporter